MASRIRTFFHRIGVLALSGWAIFIIWIISQDGIDAFRKSPDDSLHALFLGVSFYVVPASIGWALSSLFPND